MGKTCNCCNVENVLKGSLDNVEYICYCSKVTEANIKSAILLMKTNKPVQTGSNTITTKYINGTLLYGSVANNLNIKLNA